MATTVETIVGEDRSVHVSALPFAPGTSVTIVIDAATGDDRERQEREDFVARFFGSVEDPCFDVPESSSSPSIEPIF